MINAVEITDTPVPLPPWPRQAGCEAACDGITNMKHHRKRLRRFHRDPGSGCTGRHDDLCLRTHQLSGKRPQFVICPRGSAPVDNDALAFDVTELAQRLPQPLLDG